MALDLEEKKKKENGEKKALINRCEDREVSNSDDRPEKRW
jgi:hypothetical protein